MENPTVVFGLPLTVVVELELIVFDAVECGLELGLISAIHAFVWNALRLPVFEPERIHQHEFIDSIRIHQGVARSEHSAYRVTQDDRPSDVSGREQRVRVFCQLLKAILVTVWLG